MARCIYTSDVYFAAVFSSLQSNGVLDPLNIVDLFCLHLVFIPRINQSLIRFQDAWNNHPLSTESNRTPLQLYTLYSIGNPLFTDEGDVDSNSYGVDYDTDSDFDEDDSDTISIPETNLPFSDASLSMLSVSLDPQQSVMVQIIYTYRQ